MNRRNFLKAAGLALGASLLPRDIGARDSYDPMPGPVEVSEDELRVFSEEDNRRWWSLDPGQRDHVHYEGGRGARQHYVVLDEMAFQDDIDNYQMMLEENRQRHFAQWVEAKEVRETEFTDWMTEARDGPYYQTHIMTGQSYQPIFGVQSIGYAAQSNLISHATAKRMMRLYDSE
jgi:hypothetical protein